MWIKLIISAVFNCAADAETSTAATTSTSPTTVISTTTTRSILQLFMEFATFDVINVVTCVVSSHSRLVHSIAVSRLTSQQDTADAKIICYWPLFITSPAQRNDGRQRNVRRRSVCDCCRINRLQRRRFSHQHCCSNTDAYQVWEQPHVLGSTGH